MPELPEVEMVKRYLTANIINKPILDYNFLWPAVLKEITSTHFNKQIHNSMITEVQRQGKYLIFQLNNQFVIISHLKMEGKYFYVTQAHDQILLKNPNNSFIVNFADNSHLIFNDTRKFGSLYLRASDNYQTTAPLINIGADPLQKILTASYLHQAWQSKRQFIKKTLLEQKIMSGLGNIYADEVLFACCINPLRPTYHITLAECQAILDSAMLIFKASIEAGGTTISSFSSGQNHFGTYQHRIKIHRRDIVICPTCHNKVQVIKLNARSTYFCSICQL